MVKHIHNHYYRNCFISDMSHKSRIQDIEEFGVKMANKISSFANDGKIDEKIRSLSIILGYRYATQMLLSEENV